MVNNLTREELCKLYVGCIQRIRDNKDSIPPFRDVDDEYVYKFLENTNRGVNDDFFIVAFYEDKELVGGALFSIGNPWYNPGVSVLNEECTIALGRGHGICRRVAEFMEYLMETEGYDIIQASNANTPVAKYIENTYKGRDYKTFNTFYKLGKRYEGGECSVSKS